MKYFVAISLLALTLTFTVCSPVAITINGQDALPLIKSTPEGKWLTCIASKGPMDLRINKGAIEITSFTVDKIEENIRIPLRFAAIEKNNQRFSRSERLISFSKKGVPSISLKDRKISEEYLEASMDMNLENVILSSPEVSLAAQQLNFCNCFCGRKTLLLIPANPNSWYNGIAFSFDEKYSSHQTISSGKIDFVTDTGEFKIFGVKEINVIFSERAFQ